MGTDTARGGRRRRAGTATATGARGPVVRRALVAVALAAAVIAACSTPAVRTELARSFTRQDRPYLELYFTELPFLAGSKLQAQLALTAHGGPTADGPTAAELADGAPRQVSGSFVLKAEADRDGEPLATGWATVRAVDGQAQVVDVAVPGAQDADALRVSVAGRSEYVVGHLETAE
ncbi:hypothetical protein AB0G32_03825 [Streptomyces sp. NPDC023723]|uniref:hypothetical protein n=1 Tax=Streptomyces sp. NPDC023723 TaxID=3154323 RepID=UPI0033FF10D7